MALLTWGPDLSVASPQIDAEHQQLIALVNELNEAMKEGRARDEMTRVFDELIRYTQEHFASEEEWMEDVGYPGLAEHRRLHEELKQKICEFKAAYQVGEAAITVDLMHFLRDWITTHIQNEDRACGEWIARQD